MSVWEYELTNTVDGKSPGWYPFAGKAAMDLEDAFSRKVTSLELTSGEFRYEVHLDGMTQRNTTSGTLRRIRRKKRKREDLRTMELSKSEIAEVRSSMEAGKIFFGLSRDRKQAAVHYEEKDGYERLDIIRGVFTDSPRTKVEVDCLSTLLKVRLALLEAAERELRTMVSRDLAEKLMADTDSSVLTLFSRKAGEHHRGYPEHVDQGILTLIAADGPGLRVLHNDDWVHHSSLENPAVIIGASLAAISGGVLTPTTHKVDPGSGPRFSVIFRLRSNAIITLANDTPLNLRTFQESLQSHSPDVPVTTPPDDPTEAITIFVVDQHRTEVACKVKNTTRFEKILNLFASRNNIPPEEMFLCYDGMRCPNTQTIEDRNIKHGDRIDVMRRQSGD